MKSFLTPGIALGVGLVVALCAPLAGRAQTTRRAADSSGAKASTAKSANANLSASLLTDAILGDTLGRLNAQADEHFEQGEFSHTVNLYRIVVQGDPTNLSAYANSAWLLWSTDRNDAAIAFLKQGMKANPNTYYMYDELGMHYLSHLKDPATALPYYLEAVKRPCPYSTWHSLAHCYEQTGQWDKALATWQTTMAKFPDDALAKVRVPRAEAEAQRRQNAHP